MRNILAVDDDPVMLHLYSKLQSLLGATYEVFTASSPREAFALLASSKFEVVISDLSMPEMSGIDLLTHVSHSQPTAARIVISASSDQLQVAEVLNVAHQYFCKPFDLVELSRLLKRLGHYRYLLQNDRVRQIVFQTGSLPVLPETRANLNHVLDSPYTQVDDISAVVETDAGLASRLLHTVNAAHLGIARKIISCSEAIQILGLEVVRSLSIGIEVFEFFKNRPFVVEAHRNLWAHSLRTAIAARKIAECERRPHKEITTVFIAGLLHDIGKLLLAANAEQHYRVAHDLCAKSGIPMEQAERGIFGCSHADVGAYLLALWGFPDAVIEAVENHHRLAGTNSFTPALAIHAAQSLDPSRQGLKSLNLPLLKKLGYESSLPKWRSLLGPDL